MKKKILVTGAGGYIGRHVVRKLLDIGQDVIACDIYTEEIDTRATVTSLDIFSGDEDLYHKLGNPDVCLHLAWKDGFVHSSHAHMENLSKHYVFVKNLINNGLRHFAAMGTMHEIGYIEGAIDENSPCNPTSMYGIAKDALRKSVALLLNEKNVVFQWFRAYYIYGDDTKNNSIFAKLIKAQAEGKETFPFTTGKNKYDFIHVDELAQQLAISISQEKIQGIINCCTGIPVSLADKVESFIKQHNLKIKLDYGAFPDRPYDSPAVWGNAEKINQIISTFKEQKNESLQR